MECKSACRILFSVMQVCLRDVILCDANLLAERSGASKFAFCAVSPAAG